MPPARLPDRAEAPNGARCQCGEAKQTGGLRVTPKACGSHDASKACCSHDASAEALNVSTSGAACTRRYSSRQLRPAKERSAVSVSVSETSMLE